MKTLESISISKERHSRTLTSVISCATAEPATAEINMKMRPLILSLLDLCQYNMLVPNNVVDVISLVETISVDGT